MKTPILLLPVVAAILLMHTNYAHADDSPRQRHSMDFNWKFALGDPADAQTIGFNDSNWQSIDLPHDWSIYGPFDEDAPAGGGGGYLPTGIAWYRKTFQLPASLKGKHITIEFDGVYENSEVWINNHSLGKRPFGYIGFEYDLTPYLTFDQPNVLAVRVDNSVQPNSRWYSGSGIYRHTWLNVTGDLAISHWGTSVTTPLVNAQNATIEAAIEVTNRRTDLAKFTTLITILDPNGQEVATAQSNHDLDPSATDKFWQEIRLDHPRLWSNTDPALYTLRTRIRNGGELVDQYDTPFGIRTIQFDVNRGFLLNGQHVKLNGVCLHGDGGCVGSAVPEGVWLRRLTLLKEMGCNAVRTSHNPPTPEFLDMCDRLGFLVMDEAFDEWTSGKTAGGYHRFFNEWSQRDLVDFIHRDRNHPSVVLWSAGNEIPEQTLPNGVDVLKPLVDTYHREDPTRLVTAACDKAFAEPLSAPPEFAAALDVVGYNYVDRWLDRADKYYSIDRQQFPNRKFIGTESVSMGSIRGDYRGLFPDPLATTMPTTAPTTQPFRRRFRPPPITNRRVDVEQLWKYVRTYDYVSGDFMWTGIDYLGEAFWPTRSAPFGVIDSCGFKKDGFYFYQSQWTTKPVLHLFPHWTWPGREGVVIPVTCFTNCDTVELLVNGKSFGVKGFEFPRAGMQGDYGNMPERAREVRTTSDLHLSWDVPYAPGSVMAVGRIAGKVVATEELRTTGNPASIELSADKTDLAADARDVVHLTVRILDSDGLPVPTADNDVAFDIQGPAKLLGTDNGDPASHASFQANHVKAFNGMCLAIVQSTRSPGSIHVKVTADRLKTAELDLKSQSSKSTEEPIP